MQYNSMEEPVYKIEVFEGPLDLLLSLIYKNKVDITDIPIALIFDQYMDYLTQMQKLDMEIAGDFIVMGSELMLIKSRMLLPKPEGTEAEDPRTRLASALIEYKHAKEVAEDLSVLNAEYCGRFVKDTEEIPADDSFIAEHSAQLLRRAMIRVLHNRDKQAEPTLSQNLISPIIRRRIVPVGAKIIGVMRKLLRYGKQPFEGLFDTCTSRSELVATFLAVLELLKVNRINVCDPECEGGDIFIEINKNTGVINAAE